MDKIKQLLIEKLDENLDILEEDEFEWDIGIIDNLIDIVLGELGIVDEYYFAEGYQELLDFALQYLNKEGEFEPNIESEF